MKSMRIIYKRYSALIFSNYSANVVDPSNTLQALEFDLLSISRNVNIVRSQDHQRAALFLNGVHDLKDLRCPILDDINRGFCSRQEGDSQQSSILHDQVFKRNPLCWVDILVNHVYFFL